MPGVPVRLEPLWRSARAVTVIRSRWFHRTGVDARRVIGLTRPSGPTRPPGSAGSPAPRPTCGAGSLRRGRSLADLSVAGEADRLTPDATWSVVPERGR